MATEKRMIDANALMKEIKFEHDCIMQDPEIGNQMKWRESVCYQRAMRAIEKAPVIDAVEVVRCKDCVKSVPHEIFPHSRRCKVEDCRFSHKETNFCSYGERKEDGN